jgi:phosphoribosylformylglycinamidine (FGAM) synthase-like enzyme
MTTDVLTDIVPDGLVCTISGTNMPKLYSSVTLSLSQVDRSVTGLIAQQQCVGPLHTPLANVAVIAQSHFATTGMAVSVGEQPIKVNKL